MKERFEIQEFICPWWNVCDDIIMKSRDKKESFPDMDLHVLAGQVMDNCNISDATHAGVFSICGLALRMRDLYKWDKKLPPWKEDASEEILDWIGRREDAWEGMTGLSYGPITISGTSYDPFDTEHINRILKPFGLFYGAGYAYSLKPTFFLARITEERKIAGQRILYLRHEMARDLMTLPAMNQDSVIVLRMDAAEMVLWDQVQYLNKSGKPFLNYVLDQMGNTENNQESLRSALPILLDAQVETYIRHEVGEITDKVFDRKIWRKIIADFPHTPVELLARAVKDLLADTSLTGALAYLVDTKNKISLGLYAAFLDGLRRKLFPEFRAAFSRFTEKEDWGLIEDAIAAGNINARETAADIIKIYGAGKGKKRAAEEIEKRYLK